jgi:hypothetical protein
VSHLPPSDHYTGEDKQFLVSFVMRWRNKALDKTRASLQAAFQAILRKVKEVKYNEAMKERDDLQRKSLELLTNVPPGTRSEEDVEHLSSWLTKMKVRGEVGQEDEREGGKEGRREGG